MKINTQTIMLFGGGLVLGYVICKYMSKSTESVATTQMQSEQI